MIIGQKKIFLGARILWALALLLITIVFAGGPGVHLGLWSPLDGFIITLRAGFMGGLALAGLSLITLIIIVLKKKFGMGKTILTMLIGLVLAMPVIYLRMSGGGGVPPIHDITTDTVNPPVFTALVGKRGDNANSLTYEGEKLATQQMRAYPEVKPLLVADGPEAAFAKAMEVAGNMGWHMSGIDAATLRFEATDYSLWFAFADDIVVTVKATESGSQIDLRSVSRVGVSDLGVNAKRIIAFQNGFLATP